VYLKGWSGLDSTDAVKQALEVLEDAGWVRCHVTEAGPVRISDQPPVDVSE